MARHDTLYWNGEDLGDAPLNRPYLPVVTMTEEMRNAEIERMVRERYVLTDEDELVIRNGEHPWEVNVWVHRQGVGRTLTLRFTTDPP